MAVGLPVEEEGVKPVRGLVRVQPRWQQGAQRLVRAGVPGGSGWRHSWRLRPLFAV